MCLDQPVLKYKILTDQGFDLVKGSESAIGFDLLSAYEYCVEPHDRILVKTDIAIEIPEGCYGRVAPRSGLALKSFIDVGAGVIDRDYRGNVGVVLYNFGNKPFLIKRGDKVAQLILEKALETKAIKVEEISETKRGENGFGSTDIKTSEIKKLKIDTK